MDEGHRLSPLRKKAAEPEASARFVSQPQQRARASITCEISVPVDDGKGVGVGGAAAGPTGLVLVCYEAGPVVKPGFQIPDTSVVKLPGERCLSSA